MADMAENPSPGSQEELDKFRAEVWARIVAIEEGLQSLKDNRLSAIEAKVSTLENAAPKTTDLSLLPPKTHIGPDHTSFQTLLHEMAGWGMRSKLYVEPEPDDEEPGSGSHRWGASDWTVAGEDKDGFPVPKGSAEDVTPQYPKNPQTGQPMIPHPVTGVAPNN